MELLLGKTWYSPKIIFLEIVPSNVIKGGESENRDPGAWMCVVYAVMKVVLGNSKIVQKHKNRSTPIPNDAARRAE